MSEITLWQREKVRKILEEVKAENDPNFTNFLIHEIQQTMPNNILDYNSIQTVVEKVLADDFNIPKNISGYMCLSEIISEIIFEDNFAKPNLSRFYKKVGKKYNQEPHGMASYAIKISIQNTEKYVLNRIFGKEDCITNSEFIITVAMYIKKTYLN